MSDPDRPGQRIVGAMLMAVGGMVAALCGLCSALFLAQTIPHVLDGRPGELEPQSIPDAIVTVALVGGIPVLIGAGLFWLGWRLYRGPRPPRSAGVADTFE